MNYRWAFWIAVFFAGCSSSPPPPTDKNPHEHQHGAHSAAMLMVESDPAESIAGKPANLKMMIHDADGAMVSKFDVVHEKLVHLIMVRDGLDEFAHVHPEVDRDGNLTITHTFPKAGKYQLFADYKPAGKNGAIARSVVNVQGNDAPAEPLKVNAPGQVSVAGMIADVRITKPTSVKNAPTLIAVSLFNSDGTPVRDLQPYLGANGHLVAISAAGDDYAHAHPQETKDANQDPQFESHFAKSGLYKAWLQVQLAGTVHTIPFVFEVK